MTDIPFPIEEKPQRALLNHDDGEGLRTGAVYAQLRTLAVGYRLAGQWTTEH